jgi:hypothetical protein
MPQIYSAPNTVHTFRFVPSGSAEKLIKEMRANGWEPRSWQTSKQHDNPILVFEFVRRIDGEPLILDAFVLRQRLINEKRMCENNLEDLSSFDDEFNRLRKENHQGGVGAYGYAIQLLDDAIEGNLVETAPCK